MFGISWTELLVILLVAVVVIPADRWPDVARFLARAVKFIRNIIWRLADASEQLKDKIDLEQPIDELIHTTTEDILADFATPLKRINKKKTKNIKTRGTKCKK